MVGYTDILHVSSSTGLLKGAADARLGSLLGLWSKFVGIYYRANPYCVIDQYGDVQCDSDHEG